MVTKFVCLMQLTRPQDTASLFFVVVKTNADYQIMGSFVVQSEATDAIFEALSVLKLRNQKWNPSFFMVDYSEEEMSAIGNLFPGSSISNCLKKWLKYMST